MKNLENINKIVGINSKASELSKLAEQMNFVPESIRVMIERQNQIMANIPKIEVPDYNFPKLNIPNFDHLKLSFPEINIPKFDFANSELLETLKKFSKIGERIKNNPELQFAFISDLEILNLKSAEEFKKSLTSDLTDEDIQQKEELLNENLIPYLEELGLESLWLGANQVLESKSNPDKLRHCLISLRTILEYLIDEKLAPMDMLKNSSMFEKEFRKYHLGKKRIEFIKIKREQKIEYFTSKIKFGMLEEFTKNEIQYVCDCYSVLCNVHQPNVGITKNQVRSLKVKTGITIWLLAYLNKIIEN
ncbi:hypothetical protein LAG90_05290 [Marinilongibacter aquaticus]|uniref:pPIWI-associating nuclease domain-containing protein n=1 Tax=Marinilongibacter aquaticus TaxID=2975157 RepID=UPI0021BD70F0|nr:hypothetical protein [Marinilongibacter aquaticus]UBM60059.1 hypothetical protein LAG90_05290 [Marinilongibacter aquaticus]